MHAPRQADFGNMHTRILPRHCLPVHYVPPGARRNLRLVEGKACNPDEKKYKHARQDCRLFTDKQTEIKDITHS